ncbi:hypothetical protein AB8A31_02110 [Tardiphaga sp. 804_B3_N1_9]|uniref:hypothetical protein n=1 Tax=Tardiphaga sp. 804_B3_N1_9 TaxID=3240786 RepID=UPI003F23D203
MKLIEALNHLCERLEQNQEGTIDEGDAKHAHDEIMDLLHSVKDEKQIELLLTTATSSSLRGRLTGLNARLHRNTEVRLAKRYLSCHDRDDDMFAGSWINKGFPHLLSGQVSSWKRNGALGGDATRGIAVVGGGALPQTQVALFQQLGTPITSIERDPESATLCKEVLRKAGYQGLPVIEIDGSHANYQDYSIVVVATLVTQKDEVARRVAETAPSAYFAPRIPLGLHLMWREAIDTNAMNAIGWEHLDTFAPNDSSVASQLYRMVNAFRAVR